MIKNYFKIAVRCFWKDKTVSFINLAGLSVGITCIIMIAAYVRYELSYDSGYSNHDLVYRVTVKDSKTSEQDVSVPVGLAEALKNEFPEVSAYSIVSKRNDQYKTSNDVIDLNTLEGTEDFFKLFNFKFSSGDFRTALKNRGTIVLTKKIANKLFPGINPIGKTIDKQGFQSVGLTVSGVIEDIPANTHLQGDAIVSLSGDEHYTRPLNWQSFTSLPQYILLRQNADAKLLQKKISSIYKKYNFPKSRVVELQPATSIHLYSHANRELFPNGDIKNIYIFSSAGFLILLIAMINYINLATARSLQRAREIGVRKVLGAVKKQLIGQFLAESFFFFVLASILAMFFAQLAWPVFAFKMTGGLSSLPLFTPSIIILLVAVNIVSGILAGIYPAFVMTALKPVSILKGIVRFHININFRKALIVFQFVISIILIISTLIVQQQLKFISNTKLGFEKDRLLDIPFYIGDSHSTAFKTELSRNPNITSVTIASWEVGKAFGGTARMTDKNDTTKMLMINDITTDVDFIRTTQMEIVAGRDFSSKYAYDQLNMDSISSKASDEEYDQKAAARSVILNEAAVKMLGLKKPVGQFVKTVVIGHIIGVVKDFNGLTLHDKIPPIAIYSESKADFGHLFIRLGPGEIAPTIKYIEKTWKQFYPGYKCDYKFVDDRLQKFYESETRLGALFNIFSSLGIFIACMGLFGLVALTVLQRTKEIGIRKILGSSIAGIIKLISKDFLILVALSILIASPIAWSLMNKWLEDFAYKIEIQWWMFFIAGAFAISIALITVSAQAIKAALANPVKSLRNE